MIILYGWLSKTNIWHRTSYSYEYKKTLQNITILGKIYVFCHNVKEFGNFVF